MATKPKTKPKATPAQTAAQKQLAQANALLKKMNSQLKNLETQQTDLNTLSTEAKADVQTFKTVAQETRQVVESTLPVTGLIVNPLTQRATPPPTSSRQIIRQKLVDLGFPANIIEGSISFVQAIIDDGDFTDEATKYSDAVEILYNYKDFTTRKGNKLTSPFYAEFTSLGEGLVGEQRKSPKYLMEFSLAAKDLVARYGFSSQFASQDSIKKYVQNQVRITDLDERFTAATLKTAEADPNNVKTLRAMGYINDAQDLKDFYADPTIGQKEFEIRKANVAFGKQALKRADSGIVFNKTRIEQLAAGFGDEVSAEAAAAKGYETISQQLAPLVKLEGIYGTDQSILTAAELQNQLENEQFRGTASELRKRRKEQEQLAFERRSGTIGASRMSGGSLGTASTIGSV
jgi:hypothetical protein